MRKRFSLVTVVALLAVGIVIGAMLNKLFSADSILESLKKYEIVLATTQKYYVDQVDTPKLTEAAINGLLDQLDPHSVYIPASQLQRVTEEFQGSFEGIGIEFQVLNDTIRVVSPIVGGPSEALGILSGDKIVRINDTSAVGMTQETVPKKLRGPKGTRVKVTILRAGLSKPLDFDITRDKIPLYTVDAAFMVNDGIGYLRITRFAATTHEEFVEGVTKLRSQGMKRLILDLRGNAGGFLEQSFKISDELMPGGRKIVYTKGRRPEANEEYVSSGQGRFQDLTLVVLVSNGSASASEIVAGAVQDWDRGLIVGETTFGKGLVQRQIDLPDGSAFRLTTARYYTPSGRLIQRPYDKDREKYQHAAFDQDSLEGDNLNHLAEKDSARPTFKTKGGRIVYGGGGITPDYIVKSDRLNEYSVQLWSKQVFFEYATKYLDTHGEELQAKYGKESAPFAKNFEVTDEMMNGIRDLGTAKGVEFKKELFEKDLRYLKAYTKAFIARRLWGNEGWSRVMLDEDAQFKKSLGLFPEAEKLAQIMAGQK